MRFPIKLNRDNWSRAITRFVPSACDPRALINSDVEAEVFSRAVSSFKFGRTFKSTHAARFPLTIAALQDLAFPTPPAIADMGASDGTTSLDVMRAVPFRKYYVTDLNISASYLSRGKWTYFYDRAQRCILAASPRWIVYDDDAGAWFPLNRLSRRVLRGAPVCASNAPHVDLITPALARLNGGNVIIAKHDIFEPWPHEPIDLLLIGNLLNREYFSDDQIRSAIRKALAAVREEGYLAIVENRDRERATILRLVNGRLKFDRRINGGAEIESLLEASA